MKKRGQIHSEALVYLLTVFIVAVILVMGYKYINSNKNIIDKAELLQLQSKLASDIKTVGKDYGAFKKINYALPQNLNEVCFLDLTKKDDILSSKLVSFYPLIKDSIGSDSGKNVFFVGAAEQQAIQIANIKLNHYPYISCFHANKNKVEIGIEGLGGGNSLILADFVTQAKLSKDSRTVLKSADELITLDVPSGTEGADSISIEMVDPSSVSSSKGASDIYRFQPSGTKFSKPVQLTMKYDPKIVGECPQKLTFYQYKDDGSLEAANPSKAIDCKAKTAVFEINGFSLGVLGASDSAPDVRVNTANPPATNTGTGNTNTGNGGNGGSTGGFFGGGSSSNGGNAIPVPPDGIPGTGNVGPFQGGGTFPENGVGGNSATICLSMMLDVGNPVDRDTARSTPGGGAASAVTYSYSYPGGSGTAIHTQSSCTSGLPFGTYTITYLSGGPPGTFFRGFIGPNGARSDQSYSVTLPMNKGAVVGITAAEFQFQFSSLPSSDIFGSGSFGTLLDSFVSGEVTTKVMLNGQPWQGQSSGIIVDYAYPGGSIHNVPLETVGETPHLPLTEMGYRYPAGIYILKYKSGGPPGATFTGGDGAKTLSKGKTITFTFNFASSTSQTGNVQLRANLNGQAVSGSGVLIDYMYPGGSGQSVPLGVGDAANQPVGSYTITYRSGIPTGASQGTIFQSVTPSVTQTLNAGGTITFTFNFVTPQQQNGIIHLRAKNNGADWPGAFNVNYNGNSIPIGVPSDPPVPPGSYTVSYASGGPGSFQSITPSPTQTLASGGDITFTFNFIQSAPLCSLSFNPHTVSQGQNVQASWSSTGDADGILQYSCTSGASATVPASGQTTFGATQSMTCTLTAINAAGTNTCSNSITVSS